MKMRYLCLPLAVAISTCLPALQLRAMDVAGMDEVLEVVSEPAAVVGSQTEQAVEAHEELAASDETLEVAEEMMANESGSAEIEDTTDDQATETAPVAGPFPSIMIAVFEDVDDAPSLEADDTPIQEFDDVVEATNGHEVDLEALSDEQTEADQSEMVDESKAIEDCIDEEMYYESYSDWATDEYVDGDTEDTLEVAEEEMDAEEAVENVEAIDDYIDEEMDYESYSDWATDEYVDGDTEDTLEVMEEEMDSEEAVEYVEAVEDSINEEMDYESYLDWTSDEYVDDDTEDTLDVAEEEMDTAEAEENVEANVEANEDSSDEEMDYESYLDWATDEYVDGDTEDTLDVAEEEIDAAEAEENVGESTPDETPDDAEPITVRTIELDGCTVTIQSDNQMDDYQLLDALWDAVYQFESQMD
ncbi:MAG: hypothetical protein QGG71_14740 [Pirellulaceae bacterium]|nr:hypothetical protein [Pirellulaceae bacterium]